MVSSVAEDLRSTVEAGARKLAAVSAEESARRPAPGKWSPREIIGHLIDSACHNHQRFVRAQLEEDLVFAGYQQEEWVRVQAYQDAPWLLLLQLWKEYNLHIARIINSTPVEVSRRPRKRHNLHQIAWQTMPQDQPATLEYFMRDYVDHLKHHLKQISRIVAAPPGL